MLSSSGWLTAGAAAALALLALLGAFSEPPPIQRPMAPRGPAAADALSGPVALAPAPPEPHEELGPVQGVPAVPQPSTTTAGDLVQRALQSDAPQVRTEAYRLLRHCAFVLAPGTARPLASPPAWMAWETVMRADQAWQAVAERCGSLRNLPDRESVQLRLDPAPRRDITSASVEAEEQWLAGTFRQHGGAALLWAGDALVGYVEQRTNEPDGDRFDPLDAEAVQIARCHFGEDCGPDSDAARAACLTLGACEGDVPQRLLKSLLGSRAARERVQRQARALIEALAHGDLTRYALATN